MIKNLERYKRHIMLKEIGGPGQQRLAKAHVLLVGAGALGGPIALYLAAAGVGEITIYDDDQVDLSNLQRQVQFTTDDVGRDKVERLAGRLKAINPDCSIRAIRERWTGGSCEHYDLLLDGTDNFATRYALNRAAHNAGMPFVSGAVRQWVGQASVFHSGNTKGRPIDERLPCYQCFVQEEPPADDQGCDDVGVVGPLTGLVGSRLALEGLKLLTGNSSELIGRLWINDALRGTERTVSLLPDPECKTCGG